MYIQKTDSLDLLERWKSKFKAKSKRVARYADLLKDKETK